MHVYETSWSCIFVHAFLCDRYQYDPQPKRYQLPSNLFEWLLSSIWNIDSICFFSLYANDQDIFLSGDFTNANVFFSFKSTSIQSFFYNNIYILGFTIGKGNIFCFNFPLHLVQMSSRIFPSSLLLWWKSSP